MVLNGVLCILLMCSGITMENHADTITDEAARLGVERTKKYLHDGAEHSVGDIYNQWEATYDEDMVALQYKGPVILASKLRYWYPNNKDIRILDVGCGTGEVAHELKKIGYTNIDGVDASGALVAQAIERKLYKETYVEFVGGDPLPLDDNTYDAVIGSGITNIGHLPPNAISDMYRLVKPGGVLMMLCNYHTWKEFDHLHIEMQAEVDKLTDAKKWRRLEYSIMDEYAFYDVSTPGLFFVYKKL